MKKITLLAALLLSATFAFSQVKKGTIDYAGYHDYQGGVTEMYGLDFDNDGWNEVILRMGYDNDGGSWTNGAVEYVSDSVQLVAIDLQENWDKFVVMGCGEMVSGVKTFGGYGDGTFNDFTAISADSSYVGFCLFKNGNTYYAYAKIHRKDNVVYWDEIFYEATASVGITTGAKAAPEPTSVDDVYVDNESTVRKVAIEGRIYIERDGKLFDLNGRQVK